ncbi:unnamed protein product, partial [Notodromas monacha]
MSAVQFCASSNFLQPQFLLKVSESVIGMVILGLFRGALFQPGDPVVGDVDFAAWFGATTVGVGVVTLSLVVAYFVGHTPGKQERN